MEHQLNRFMEWAENVTTKECKPSRQAGLTIEKESEKERRCYDAKKQLSDSGNK